MVDPSAPQRPPAPETGKVDALLGLIGLGAGSTPSGDDILVGMLAGLSVLENTDSAVADHLAGLRACIRESMTDRTALPSAQTLLTACELSFGDPILRLLMALTNKNATETTLRERMEHVA